MTFFVLYILHILYVCCTYRSPSGTNPHISHSPVQVWCLRAVSLQEQLAQLLATHRLDEALSVCRAALTLPEGESWAEASMAHVGLLYILQGMLTDGLAVLRHVAPEVLQPAVLLRLMPEVTSSSVWTGEVGGYLDGSVDGWVGG